MNNIYMKRNKTKKARGFSKINTNTRITRTQTKQLSDAYDLIIKKLSSSHKDKLNKNMSIFQNTFRVKLHDKKSKSKKVSKYNSPVYTNPVYYKTLEELPSTLVDKLLSKIPQFIKDDEAKNLLINAILASKVSNVFNKSMDNIFEFNKTILKYCKVIKSIHINDDYPSSADDEEREIIDDRFRDINQNLREKKIMVYTNLNHVLVLKENIVTQLDNILKILNNKDDDSKIIENFINLINIVPTNNLFTTNTSYFLNLKIEDLKKKASYDIEKAKNSFERLLKTKLIFSKDKSTIMNGIIRPIYDSTSSIDDSFSKFEKFIESKKKSKSRASSSRR
tara:strand:+ start:1292 stop:2299 length:1008 start_codon:yes stop_codon:yes gene_type:complete